MGCWWSTAGAADCRCVSFFLVHIAFPHIRLGLASLNIKTGNALEMPNRSDWSALLERLPRNPGTYVDLRMLIQNHTKQPRMAIGTELVAVITSAQRDAFLRGRKPGEVHVSLQTADG
jgi:hypothetical protein